MSCWTFSQQLFNRTLTRAWKKGSGRLRDSRACQGQGCCLRITIRQLTRGETQLPVYRRLPVVGVVNGVDAVGHDVVAVVGSVALRRRCRGCCRCSRCRRQCSRLLESLLNGRELQSDLVKREIKALLNDSLLMIIDIQK